MLVNIDNDAALELLINRLKFWTDDADVIALYERMYENYIDCGCFDGGEFDVMVIVDNDYINYCDIISPGDNCYDDIKSLFARDGLGDISCDYELNCGYSFIEAEYNGHFLVRC
jgi:hypothetical protein